MSVEKSQRRRHREQKRRRAQERRWAALSGPVTVRQGSDCPDCEACSQCGHRDPVLVPWKDATIDGAICMPCVHRNQAATEEEMSPDV